MAMKASIIQRAAVACLAGAISFSSASTFAGDLDSAIPSDTTFRAKTAPSEQRGLNFNVPGVVSKVLVKEGDAVKAGQIIAQQDDSVEQAELAVKQAEVVGAELKIKAQNADLAAKRVELKRSELMAKDNVLGQQDLDKARVEVVIGEIAVHLAEQETAGKKLEVMAQQAKIAQKKLYSTINGFVQQINVHEGELATNDPKTPCMQVVLNDPLYVEVDVPVVVAHQLKLNQKLEVKYAGSSDWQAAPIIYFNPVADPKSGTQRVRLQLPNSAQMRSGEQMQVKVDEKVAAITTAR
ncbi:MAG TPA: efflux RND transporter periplasmic adaptor subunit [Tepidisphaeraceae bacterium]|nr:efflux RND transporter periplasmic adaptor subunit [Tepidisphaeraceae bacterium]